MENFQELDRLVIDYLRFERELSCANENDISEDARIARALLSLKSLLRAGRVDDAEAVCRKICPEVMEDANLQLELRVHKLIELLHMASTIPPEQTADFASAQKSALKYAGELASFALSSDPEAYPEFTKAMILFAYPGRTADSGALQQRRDTLARHVVSVARATLGAREPALSRLIKYVLLIHVSFQQSQGSVCPLDVSDKIASLVEDFLRVEDREGNDDKSFQDTYLVFNHKEKVIPSSETEKAGSAENSKAECASSAQQSQKTKDNQVSSHSQDFSALSDNLHRFQPAKLWTTDSLPPVCTSSSNRNFPETDVQSLPARFNISRQSAIESLKFTEGNVVNALRNELGRVVISKHVLQSLSEEYCAYRGLKELESPAKDNGCAQQQSQSQPQSHLPVSSFLSPRLKEIYQSMRRIRELAEHGNIDGIVQTATKIDPQLLETSPTLKFRVHQSKLVRLLRDGDHEGAMRIARNELGPLSEGHSELLELLKETGMLLAYPCVFHGNEVFNNSGKRSDLHSDPKRQRIGTDSPVTVDSPSDICMTSDNHQLDELARAIESRLSTPALAGQIYRALSDKLGEPKLVSVLRTMLETHRAWLKHNVMMQDEFADAIGLSALARSGDLFLTRGDGQQSENRSGDPGNAIGSDSEQNSSRSTRVSDESRESKVLTLMEFLALTRADALLILQQHGPTSNPQEIIEALMEGGI